MPQFPAESQSQRHYREQRASERFRCEIAASSDGKSRIGQITDIALGGCFVQTASNLDVDGPHTVVFSAGKFGRVAARAEVVRVSQTGVGMKFTQVPAAGRRRLRRLVAELNAVEGHREEAASFEEGAASDYTIVEESKVRALFDRAVRGTSQVSLIPDGKTERHSGRLASRSGERLVVKSDETPQFEPGSHVFALLTVGYDSYSFRAQVVGAVAEEKQISLGLPSRVGFSERRSVLREQPRGEAVVSLSVPWKKQPARWPIYDLSDGGFAMRVSSGNALFLPGTPLRDATLEINGETTSIRDPVVKHVTHIQEDDGSEWWKIGVSRGVERVAPELSHRDIAAPQKASRLTKLREFVRDLGDKATYLFHTRIRPLGHTGSEEPFRLVRLANLDDRNVVGLLNLSYPSSGRKRMPLVLIVPAFGSRKETLSALAQTLTHNFRRNNRDLAVLRVDGVNNLGESDKDPGLHRDGMQTMHYTVSEGVSDILGALVWARSNPHFEATETILVSVSFSSIAARVAMTRPEASCVARWIVYMGAADVQNCIMNVSGNFDAYGRYLRGMRNGVVTLQGCMVDGDRFCADVDELNAATVEDARRDLMGISAPITWMIGSHDAWMDPSRIGDIMSAAAPGEREILEVDAGHTPTSSDEALAQFRIVTQLVWSQLYGEQIAAASPPRGLVAAVSEQEWRRVRSDDSLQTEEYWANYLLNDDKLGYDLLRYLPAYREFAALQAAEADAADAKVLDLGAGTGIVSAALADLDPSELVCVDVVGPALDKIRSSLTTTTPVRIVQADADGNSRTALRRWLRGELASVGDLVGRVPGVTQTFADSVMSNSTEDLHALLRGADLATDEVRMAAGLPASMDALLHDINVLARIERGLLSNAEAAMRLRRIPARILESEDGLPFSDEAFGAIVCSLLLSYLDYPSDCLSECHRILKPGGRLVVSSMKPDADTSTIYRAFIDQLENTPDSELPDDRERLLTAARELLNKAAELFRHEKEGLFRFFDAEQLSAMVRRAGFAHVRILHAYGTPPQAIVVSCRKPETAH